jgi:type III secretion system needle length determinant
MTKVSDQIPPSSIPEADFQGERSKSKSGQGERDIEDEADKFSSLMKKSSPEIPRKVQGKKQGQEEHQGGEESMSPGDALLQSLQGARVNRQAEGAGSPGQAGLSEAAREIAEKILVSDASAAGKQEVRITLKDSVLPGTEIRISQEENGLRIQLLTRSADSYRLLTQESKGLQEYLSARLGQEVRTEVGFASSGGEENEGRSRQQRSVFDEVKD